MVYMNCEDAQCPRKAVETVSPGGTFCDTVQVPSGAGDTQLI